MAEFWLKKDDLLPSIEATLTASNSTTFMLTATGVNFKFRLQNSQVTQTRTGVIVDAAARKVRYDWVSGDTAVAGVYLAEWQLLFAGSKSQTFPNQGYVTFEIIADL